MRELDFDGRGSTVRWSNVPGGLPARVFIHGLGGMGAAVSGDFATDPALGSHRSLVIDLPGHGLCDRPSDFGYTLDEHAGVIAAICRAEGLGSPEWARTGRLCAPHAIYRSAVGLITGTDPTMRTMLMGLTIPRVFIRGENGEPLRDAERLGAAGVDVVTIPNAGHMMMWDAPADFARVLAAALAA